MPTHKNVVQVSVLGDVYTGGAHGMQSVIYMLFDMDLQTQVSLADITEPTSHDMDNNIIVLAEEAYKRYILDVVYSKEFVPDDNRLDSQKLAEYQEMYPFELTENVYFGEKGLVFSYNPYHLGI